jgi:RNA polymerase sigma-70 factor, ECF subfamily
MVGGVHELNSKFEKLYDTYYNCIYRYIYASVKDKWNAEDIIATVFMKIYDARSKIQDIEGSKNWVFKIAHNTIIDFYRKNNKVICVNKFFEQGEEDAALEEVLIKDEFEKVNVQILRLPEEIQQIIYMRYYGELKYKEIAEVLNKPESTIKTIIYRTLENLKEMYEIGGEVNEKR